jgi:hypothetical protein
MLENQRRLETGSAPHYAEPASRITSIRASDMLEPFESPITEVTLYLRLFITTSGGW